MDRFYNGPLQDVLYLAEDVVHRLQRQVLLWNGKEMMVTTRLLFWELGMVILEF
jgi:hypothetical protein